MLQSEVTHELYITNQSSRCMCHMYVPLALSKTSCWVLLLPWKAYTREILSTHTFILCAANQEPKNIFPQEKYPTGTISRFFSHSFISLSVLQRIMFSLPHPKKLFSGLAALHHTLVNKKQKKNNKRHVNNSWFPWWIISFWVRYRSWW